MCPPVSGAHLLPLCFPSQPASFIAIALCAPAFTEAMASYGGFDDLELIMERNVHRALASSRPAVSAQPPSVNSTHPEVGVEEFVSEEEVLVTSEAPGCVGNPLPSAASISLALASVLSSSLVFTKNNLMPQASHRGKLGPAISAAAPSQKKSHSPMPVMASSKVQVALDIPVATPITVSKKSNFVSAFPEYERLRGPDFKDPGNAAGLRRASIVWFRNDLRVHDNEALVTASRDSLSVLPVYCFDPRDYGKSSSGFDKTGPYRAKFLLECVANLRSSLRERGSELIVRIGRPEEVLVDLARSAGADALYLHQEVTHEELQEGDFVAIYRNSYTPWFLHKGIAVKRSWNALNREPFQSEEKVAAALQERGVETKYFWGSTLFHLDDLPFKLQDMPSNYGGFREKVQNVAVRDTIEAPQQLKGLPACGNMKPGDIPSLQELGLNPAAALRQDSQTAGGAGLVGGEDEALKRLQSFALEVPSQAANKSKVGSNGSEPGGDSLYGANFSCKISPWLAMGCLSPRRMFEDLKKSGSSAGAMSNLAVKASGGSGDDNGLNWLVFELLWRDFFRFITKKYGTGKKNAAVSPATACTGSFAAA